MHTVLQTVMAKPAKHTSFAADDCALGATLCGVLGWRGVRNHLGVASLDPLMGWSSHETWSLLKVIQQYMQQ